MDLPIIPMETMDLPWIYLLFPWKPWQSRNLLEAFDHFQVDYTELRGPWQVRHLRGGRLGNVYRFL